MRGRAASAAALSGGLLLLAAIAPASAHAADLFPVDDWLGDGIKKAGEVVLGPLKLGVEEIARLIATVVGALADLLVPKSFVRAGIDGVRWLVALPPVGAPVDNRGLATSVRMPHLLELRQTLTWIGVTLLPLGLVISAGRAMLAPTVDGEGPIELVARALAAGAALLVYDWAWGVLVRLVRLLTDALLALPWVDDGIERMLETLLIGGGAGTVVAAEFVVPLLIAVAGGALLGLLLVHVGLEVVTALVYALGGLVLGLSGTQLGRRLLAGWLIAVTAVVVLPLLWTVVFVTGAALMLDAGPAGGSGFGGFVAQLFNVAAALAVFWLAIKLALGVFRQASTAVTGLAAAPVGGAAGAHALRGPSSSQGSAGRAGAIARNATPAGLARFSQSLRSGLRAGGMAATLPVRRPVVAGRAAAHGVRHPIQSTHEVAGRLRSALNTRGHAAGRASQSRSDSQSTAGAPPARRSDPRRRSRTAGTARRETGRRPRTGDRSASTASKTAAQTGQQRSPRATEPSVRIAGSPPWWWGRPRQIRGTNKRGGNG